MNSFFAYASFLSFISMRVLLKHENFNVLNTGVLNGYERETYEKLKRTDALSKDSVMGIIWGGLSDADMEIIKEHEACLNRTKVVKECISLDNGEGNIITTVFLHDDN